MEGAGQDALWASAEGVDSRILNATGNGFADNWGAKPLGLSDEDSDNLRKLGMFNDFTSGHDTFLKAANEAVLRPTIATVDAAFRAIPAIAGGAAAGLAQTATEISGDTTFQPQPTNVGEAIAYPFAAASELLQGVPAGAYGGEIGGEPLGTAPHVAQETASAMEASRAQRLDDALRARASGGLGEGEASFYGAAPLTPENLQARQEAAAQVGIDMPEPLPPPPDVHSLARRIDPETFAEYDTLNAEAALHRDTIARLGEERAASPEAVSAQGDIDTILGRVNGVEDRLTKAAAGRLADAQGRLDTALKADTPEMTAARDQLMDVDFRMRDLAVPVSMAYRDAREIAPQIPEEAPVEARAATTPEKAVSPEIMQARAEVEAAQNEIKNKPSVEAGQRLIDARTRLGALGERPEEAVAEPTPGEAAKPQEAPAGPQEPAQAPPAPPSDVVGQEAASVGASAAGASAEGHAAVAPPNVLGETLGRATEAAPETAAPVRGETLEPGNPRSTSAIKTIQGEGEETVLRVAERSEENAIAAGLADNFGDLPTSRSLKDEDQAAIVTKMMGEDYERAKAIAMGTREPPKGATPEAFLIGVENRALAEGDFDTVYALKDTRLATAGRTMGQRISTYRLRSDSSPVSAMQDIEAARETAVGSPAINSAVADMEVEVRKASTDRNAAEAAQHEADEAVQAAVKAPRTVTPKAAPWKNFIDSITCGE